MFYRIPVPLFAVMACGLLDTGIPLQAATYYVTKTGADSNPCTQAQPCLTLGRAKNLAIQPNDVVQVGAGTYNERLTLSTGGSGSGKITFRGQDGSGCPTTAVTDVNHPTGKRPSSSVIIVGGFVISASYIAIDCFHLKSSGSDIINPRTGTSNVDITNNEIDGAGLSSPGSGVFFAGVGSVSSSQYAANYSVRQNYIHGVSTGIFVVCNTCTFQDNEIASLQGNEPGSDLDYVDVWGMNTIIRHNYMHDNTINACNSFDCHMDCIQTWNTTGNGTEVSKNITFDRNICFNHHEGVIAQDNAGNGDVSNWTVTNNVFAFPPWDDGSGHPGVAGPVHPWCWIFEDGNLGTGNVFYNNTCFNGGAGFRNAVGTASFKDNIFYRTDSGAIYQNGGGTIITGANNLQMSQGNPLGAAFSGDISNQNPQFVSLGSNSQRCVGCNFRLQSTSPAIGAGVNTGVVYDLTGLLRSAYDIGAYQYSSAPSGVLPPTGLTAVIK